MRPRSERGRPRTSARYSRSSARSRTSDCSRAYACSVFATTSSPDVSRSRRCTIPRRSSSPPAATPTSPCTSVPVSWPGAGWTTRPAGLSITRGTRPRTRRRAPALRAAAAAAPAAARTRRPPHPASRHAFARATPSTITPRFDHALGGRARADVLRDERVEPRAGRVVRNANAQGGPRRAARAAGRRRRRR